MAKINYINLYLTTYERIYHDYRLTSTHVSLYFSLLHFYNLSRFSVSFCVARSQLKTQSKIKSNKTYTKAISDLVSFGYIRYAKSNSPHVASLFSIVKLQRDSIEPDSTSSKNEPVVNQFYPTNSTTSLLNELALPPTSSENEQVLPPSKTNKQNGKTLNQTRNDLQSFSPPSLNEVNIFFKESGSTKKEGNKFFNHYTANGWKIGGKTPMVDWNASARNWIGRSSEFNKKDKNYLNSEEDKDYSAKF